MNKRIARIVPIRRCSWFQGSPHIPGDKSISHRALIFGSLAEGITEISGLLESEDVLSTENCLKKLGAQIWHSNDHTYVRGTGWIHSTPSQAPIELDCGNSGTTIRLLMGLVAGQEIQANFTGDASLRKRPMRRVAEPLEQMGAQIHLTDQNFAPLTVQGQSLHGMVYTLPVASAQIKSALILAALSARGTTILGGQIQSRDHSERMLKQFGAQIVSTDTEIRIEGPQLPLRATQVQVPGDPSTAAFWIAAASLIPPSSAIPRQTAGVTLNSISLNPSRLGFIRVLQRMGANIQMETTGEGPEPIGTIRVFSSALSSGLSAPLQGTRILADEIPFLIDELPLLAVVASQAHGVTEVQGAEELRFKESDRLEVLASNLRAMGVQIQVKPDGFQIQGPQTLHGARIQTHDDHRIAMAFSIAGLMAEGLTEIEGAECVAISYPRFYPTLEELTDFKLPHSPF